MLLALALLLQAGAPADAPPPVATTPAPAPGSSAATAYVVGSIDEEYQIMRERGLTVRSQALMMVNNRPYDRLNGVDPKTGASVTLWFDISRFFGKVL